MSNPEPNKSGFHAYTANVSWEVPEGGQLHKFNFTHDCSRTLIQMDKNGENAVVWKPPTGISKLWKRKDENPGKFSFKFGKLQLEVLLVYLPDGYIYALDVNEKSLKRYKEDYYQWYNVWKVNVDGVEWRIVLDKKALEVWGNGEKIEDAKMTFAENGVAVSNFVLCGSTKCKIEGQGDKKTGITHTLLVNGNQVPLDIDLDEPLYRRYDHVKSNLSNVGII
ncbi:unnamed protein product [Caenorhabditis brenneri]